MSNITNMAPLALVQQAALVLNASRRFRYTLDLKKEEEKEEARKKIRAHAQAIRLLGVPMATFLAVGTQPKS
ncbi:hypothetical protein EJ110_NYTH24698 [Nymphaea thermarum]|nr:hypothetical protein EJ110_NYTH24698 [Nymphaea thermarum]